MKELTFYLAIIACSIGLILVGIEQGNASQINCQIINPIPPTDCSLSTNLKRRGAPVDCKEA